MIAVVVIIVGAVGVISLSSQSNVATSSSSPSPRAGGGIAPFIEGLSARNVSCSLASGVCAFTIVNNSTASLELEDCQMTVVVSVNVTTTTYTASSELATTTYITFENGSISTVVSTPSSSVAAASTVTQTVTAVSNVNGTMGGPATAGIPANSQAAATCTMPTAQLGNETQGSIADGVFQAKLVDSAYGYPAGTEMTFGFEGTWSH